MPALPATWPMYHGTPDRAGYSAAMPAASGTPKVIARLKLDGAVYAAPIVVGELTIVATENDTVYAFDSTYHQVWKRNLGKPATSANLPCGNISPLGITGTPVYSVASGLLYVVAEHGGSVKHELVALNPRTGDPRWRQDIDLPGADAAAMQERGALAVSGGRVWVPFGGLDGDCGDYKGRLIGVKLDGSLTPDVYTVPSRKQAGIWTPPGPSVAVDGNLFVAVGNGASGVGQPYDHSDSVLELDPSGRLVDSFSPSTWATDNEQDLDLGSQGPALVGPWVLTVGKSGIAYVLRQNHLGGIGGQVSKSALCASFGGTAVVGDTVYVPCTDAGLVAVRIDASGRLHLMWHAASAVHGSPVVGGGRVWALDASGGVLHALNPNTGRSVGSVQVGTTSRFATPALAGRDVLVPTLAGLTVVGTS